MRKPTKSRTDHATVRFREAIAMALAPVNPRQDKAVADIASSVEAFTHYGASPTDASARDIMAAVAEALALARDRTACPVQQRGPAGATREIRYKSKLAISVVTGVQDLSLHVSDVEAGSPIETIDIPLEAYVMKNLSQECFLEFCGIMTTVFNLVLREMGSSLASADARDATRLQ